MTTKNIFHSEINNHPLIFLSFRINSRGERIFPGWIPDQTKTWIKDKEEAISLTRNKDSEGNFTFTGPTQHRTYHCLRIGWNLLRSVVLFHSLHHIFHHCQFYRATSLGFLHLHLWHCARPFCLHVEVIWCLRKDWKSDARPGKPSQLLPSGLCYRIRSVLFLV